MTILISQRSQKDRIFAIAIVLQSFVQMAIGNRDLNHEKNIAIDDRRSFMTWLYLCRRCAVDVPAVCLILRWSMISNVLSHFVNVLAVNVESESGRKLDAIKLRRELIRSSSHSKTVFL